MATNLCFYPLIGLLRKEDGNGVVMSHHTVLLRPDGSLVKHRSTDGFSELTVRERHLINKSSEESSEDVRFIRIGDTPGRIRSGVPPKADEFITFDIVNSKTGGRTPGKTNIRKDSIVELKKERVDAGIMMYKVIHHGVHTYISEKSYNKALDLLNIREED